MHFILDKLSRNSCIPEAFAASSFAHEFLSPFGKKVLWEVNVLLSVSTRLSEAVVGSIDITGAVSINSKVLFIFAVHTSFKS